MVKSFGVRIPKKAGAPVETLQPQTRSQWGGRVILWVVLVGGKMKINCVHRAAG
jgi:hypothetical protein